jgi:hypothetical protein
MAPRPAWHIWIGGLDRDVSVEDIRAMFEPFGDIDEGIFLRVDLDHQVGGEAVVTYVLERASISPFHCKVSIQLTLADSVGNATRFSLPA